MKKQPKTRSFKTVDTNDNSCIRTRTLANALKGGIRGANGGS